MESGLAERCAADGVWCAGVDRPDSIGTARWGGHNRAYQPEPPVPGLKQIILTPFLPTFSAHDMRQPTAGRERPERLQYNWPERTS